MVLSKYAAVVLETQIVALPKARPNIRINVTIMMIVMAPKVALKTGIAVHEIVVVRVIIGTPVVVVDGFL